MNTSERDSILDRALDALRDDAPAGEQLDAAANRVWAELRANAAAESGAGAAHETGTADERTSRPTADGTGRDARGLTLIEPPSGSGSIIRSCADVRTLLSDAHSADLRPARRVLLRDHLTTCPDCRRAVGTTAAAGTADADVAEDTVGGTRVEHGQAAPLRVVPAPTDQTNAPRSGVTRTTDRTSADRTPARGWLHRLSVPRAVAAAVVLAVGLLAAGVMAPSLVPAPVVASAAEVSEGLYRIEDGRLVPLEPGAELHARQRVRAGRTAGALLRLADGSVVELDARTEVALAERDGRTVVELVRGAIVAGADAPAGGSADGSAGGASGSVAAGPEIISGPLTAYADGALVAVTEGPLGTRITALDGDVRVTTDDDDTRLSPGQQMTSHPRVGQVAPRQEVAWSVALADRLARLEELKALEATMAAAPQPELRYESLLLGHAPAETLVYAALPNLSTSLSEVEAELDAQLAASPALQAWWAEAVDVDKGPTPQAVLARLIALGTPLGDELAIALYGADANDPRPVVLAEVDDADALRAAIADELARIAGDAAAEAAGDGEPMMSRDDGPAATDTNARQPLEVRVLDDASALEAALTGQADEGADTTGQAGDAAERDDVLWLWLGDGWLAAATEPTALRDARAGGFTEAPLGMRLQNAYADGVGWLLGADLGALSRAETEGTTSDAPDDSEGPDEQTDVAALAGLDAAFLVANQRARGGVTQSDATIHFADGRSGVAAWLAQPGPVGALDLVAPDAHLAAAFTVADPTLMLADLLMLAGDSVPEVADGLDRAADRAALEALAGATGGEVAIALEGPVLPKPGWKVVLEVYDETAFQEALVATVARLDTQLQAEDGPRVTLEPVGDGRYVLRVDDEIEAVHLGYIGGYLVAVPAPVMLDRTARDYALGRSLGQAGVLRAGLPDGEAPHVSALVYQNLRPVIGPAVDQLARLESLSGEQQALLERAQAELAPQVLVVRAAHDRIALSTRAESSWLSGDLNQLIGRGGFFGLATLLETAELAADAPTVIGPAVDIE